MVKGQGHIYLHERSQKYIFGIGGHVYLSGNKSLGGFGPKILEIFIAGLLQVTNMAFSIVIPNPILVMPKWLLNLLTKFHTHFLSYNDVLLGNKINFYAFLYLLIVD